MSKCKKIIAATLVGVLVAAGSVVCGSQGMKSVFGEGTPVVWKHYNAIAPTASSKGIKQYWVSCDDNNHVFEKPTGNVSIEEGSWTDELQASVLALEDDRTIQEGDFITWMHSAGDFMIGTLSNKAYDASSQTYTFRAGDYKGTDEEPLVNATDAAIHFRSQYLRVARACGWKYLSFSLKANSVMEGYKVNRFAIATSGVESIATGWQINYQEKDLDVETMHSYQINLADYDAVTEENFSFYFGFRNSSAPQFNSVVCDVTVKDIAVSKMTSFSIENTDNVTLTAAANDLGLITDITLNQEGSLSPSHYDLSGLTAGYISDLHDAGYDKLYINIKATDVVKVDEAKENLGFFSADGNISYPDFFDKWMTFEVNTESGKAVHFGVAHGGGGSNPSAFITAEISYSKLMRNEFNGGENSASRWGIDMSKFSLENSAPGAGTVGGSTVKSNGASVTVNGVEHDVVFYGNFLELKDYTPSLNDVVVYHAGTYDDPENSYDVHRRGVLTENLEFVFVGGTFIQQ